MADASGKDIQCDSGWTGKLGRNVTASRWDISYETSLNLGYLGLELLFPHNARNLGKLT